MLMRNVVVAKLRKVVPLPADAAVAVPTSSFLWSETV